MQNSASPRVVASSVAERAAEHSAPEFLARLELQPAAKSGLVRKPVAQIQEQDQPMLVPEIVLKRRKLTSEDDLRKQLLKVPEISLDKDGKTFAKTVKLARGDSFRHATKAKNEKPVEELVLRVIAKRPDLAGLPLLKGKACRLDKKTAKAFEKYSMTVRRQLDKLRQSRQGNNNNQARFAINYNILHSLISGQGPQPEGVKALQQLLMSEDTELRSILVDRLASANGSDSSVRLARRALFDLDPEVRVQALAALNVRPRSEYREVLLAGFQYPWPAVADHAAEALVALRMRDAVPDLVNLLEKNDMFGPFTKEIGQQKVLHVREVVRINHLKNCFLCHAPSFSLKDLVRGLVPTPGKAIPSSRERYYHSSRSGDFVRADVTYLRQDFSVPQEVANPDKWPKIQRFDFLVRVRRLTHEELAKHDKRAVKPLPPCEQREAILWALSELTGKKLGIDPAKWKKAFPSALDNKSNVTAKN